MNRSQLIVLIAVCVIFIGMFLYPPFHFIAKDGAVHNMGYGWLFSPPAGGRATVNVFMLLAQCIGVLVVGGLAFFVANTTSDVAQPSGVASDLEKSSNASQNTESDLENSSPIDNSTHSKSGPSGVRGWLLLLVIGMMLIGPLLGAQGTGFNIALSEQQYPRLTTSEPEEPMQRNPVIESWLHRHKEVVGEPEHLVDWPGWRGLPSREGAVLDNFLSAHMNGEEEGVVSATAAGDQWQRYKAMTWGVFIIMAAISFYGGWGLARGNDWSVVNRAKAILWIAGPGSHVVLGFFVPFIAFGEADVIDDHFVGSFLCSIIGATIWTLYLVKSKRVRNTYSRDNIIQDPLPHSAFPKPTH